MEQLLNIARKLRGHNCEMLIKRTANEVVFSGAVEELKVSRLIQETFQTN